MKIAIVGIGNAGNQICNDAAAEGIPAFCINSSSRDLEIVNSAIDVFLFGNADGAGKDRDIAKSYVKETYKTLLREEAFTKVIDDKDIVFIAASTGGGTGSGASVILMDILSKVYKHKVFIGIGILPTLSESVGSQRNTLEWLREIKRLDKPYMIYDNNKYKDISANIYMKKVNSEIINAILYIRGDYSFRSQFGMIDDADMYKIVSVPGMLNVTYTSKFQEKDVEEEGKKLDSLIIKAMKNNGTVTLDRDRIVKRMGTILNITDDLSKYYDPSLNSIKELLGEPIEQFDHLFINNDTTEYPTRICVISSGLSIPDDRINLIIQRITEVEEALRKKKDHSYLDDLESLDSLKIGGGLNRNQVAAKSDIESIDIDFNNY